jgi:hypothetical protein
MGASLELGDKATTMRPEKSYHTVPHASGFLRSRVPKQHRVFLSFTPVVPESLFIQGPEAWSLYCSNAVRVDNVGSSLQLHQSLG